MLKKLTDKILSDLDAKTDYYGKIDKTIWQNPELGCLEENSSQLLQETLQREGFSIKSGVADILTAFVAEYGSGTPMIAILTEFDALLGISQKAIPQREAIIDGSCKSLKTYHNRYF